MGEIYVKNLVKDFEHTQVLKNINLTVKDQSFTILLGPSGCGKSTLLRIIAGLEEPTSGEIFIDDTNMTKYKPKDRNVAMVFQNYALYPHMNVYKNIEYGLRVRKIKKQERHTLITEALAQVELTDQKDKLPSQMSGGQRQRVAIARALVKRPKVYLMDEPLSNLDAKLRTQMRFELIDMYKKIGTTFLYVTHDQVEAMSMGTHIVLMNKGEIAQQGTSKEIYENPANIFVAQFIGSPPTNILKLDDFYLGIRPESIALDTNKENDFSLKGHIRFYEHLGSETVYHLETPLGNLIVKSPNSWETKQGKVYAGFNKNKIFLFHLDGSRIQEDLNKYHNKFEKIIKAFT